MSISTVIDAVQTIHGNITGITSAPTALPGALNTSELPFVFTWPGPAEWNKYSSTTANHIRTYIVRVYVWPVAQGEGVDEGYQDCLPLLQAFGEEYLSDITLGGAVEHIGTGTALEPPTCSDTGVTVLDYAGIDYHGFEFTFMAKEQVT